MKKFVSVSRAFRFTKDGCFAGANNIACSRILDVFPKGLLEAKRARLVISNYRIRKTDVKININDLAFYSTLKITIGYLSAEIYNYLHKMLPKEYQQGPHDFYINWRKVARKSKPMLLQSGLLTKWSNGLFDTGNNRVACAKVFKFFPELELVTAGSANIRLKLTDKRRHATDFRIRINARTGKFFLTGDTYPWALGSTLNTFLRTRLPVKYRKGTHAFYLNWEKV